MKGTPSVTQTVTHYPYVFTLSQEQQATVYEFVYSVTSHYVRDHLNVGSKTRRIHSMSFKVSPSLWDPSVLFSRGLHYLKFHFSSRKINYPVLYPFVPVESFVSTFYPMTHLSSTPLLSFNLFVFPRCSTSRNIRYVIWIGDSLPLNKLIRFIFCNNPDVKFVFLSRRSYLVSLLLSLLFK